MTAVCDSAQSAVEACRGLVTDWYAEERSLQQKILRRKAEQEAAGCEIGIFEEKLTLIFSTLDSAKSAVPDCSALIGVREKEAKACRDCNSSAQAKVDEMEGKRRSLVEEIEALLQVDLQEQEAAAAAAGAESETEEQEGAPAASNPSRLQKANKKRANKRGRAGGDK